jgi:branched-chain amino acid transport system ATP-binding protein/neutral amino acid transport system ATP-binding protein
VSGQKLVCDAIRKSFGGVIALNDVSCSFESGRMTAIIGPNGAGKTTLLNVMTGYLTPDSGRVLLDGVEITGRPPYRIARLGSARTFQQTRIVRSITVLDNVLLAVTNEKDDRFGRSLVGIDRARGEELRARAESALRLTRLIDYATHPAASLSFGQQKMLSFAACLATGAKALLLDEPFAGVQPDLVDSMIELMRTLCAGGYSIALIEHNLGAVRRAADTVHAFHHGRLISTGEPAVVLDAPQLLDAYLH